jgi:hypothetical protein
MHHSFLLPSWAAPQGQDLNTSSLALSTQCGLDYRVGINKVKPFPGIQDPVIYN